MLDDPDALLWGEIKLANSEDPAIPDAYLASSGRAIAISLVFNISASTGYETIPWLILGIMLTFDIFTTYDWSGIESNNAIPYKPSSIPSTSDSDIARSTEIEVISLITPRRVLADTLSPTETLIEPITPSRGDFISKESRTTWFSWADNSAEYTACFCLSIWNSEAPESTSISDWIAESMDAWEDKTDILAVSIANWACNTSLSDGLSNKFKVVLAVCKLLFAVKTEDSEVSKLLLAFSKLLREFVYVELAKSRALVVVILAVVGSFSLFISSSNLALLDSDKGKSVVEHTGAFSSEKGGLVNKVSQ